MHTEIGLGNSKINRRREAQKSPLGLGLSLRQSNMLFLIQREPRGPQSGRTFSLVFLSHWVAKKF